MSRRDVLDRLSTSPQAKAKRRERGVALLIVVTILVTMVIVAVPFALSMLQGQERTQAVAARGRATFEASLLAEITKLFLARTHPENEQRRFARGDRTVDAQPGVDSLDEITPNDAFRKRLEEQILSQWDKDPRMAGRAEYLRSRGLGPLNDDRGSIWSVSIQDAQALANVNGASPFLLANLMGSALLSDDMDTGGGDIAVEHVVTGRFGGLRGFPPSGGLVRVGNEVIRYEEFDGTVFRGCERAVLQGGPLGDNGSAGSHEKGTPVIDYTAYKLATHLIARRPGSMTPFSSLEALRDIASWGEDGVLSADRLERLLPYLTVWSRRETSSGWLAEQLIMNELPASADSTEPEQIRLRDIRDNPSGTTAYFNPGTLMRITDGIQTVYQSVTQVGDDDGRQRGNYVTVAGPVTATIADLTFKGGETTAAAYAPYPININTASRTILYAVMANLQFWRSEGKEQIVTPELAWELAGEIERTRKDQLRSDPETGRRISGPFRSAKDFGHFLEAKVSSSELSRVQHAALYTNALNPHSWNLRFGTAPWCYRTLDVYHVEARVALNNRAGEQIAEAGVREVVEIGSDTTAAWVLDSQEDFEQRIAMGSGAKWVTTYPFGVAYKDRGTQHIQPSLRAPKGFVNNVYPDETRDEAFGDVRLEPARLLLEGAQVIEHFDHSWFARGHYTTWDGAYTRPTVGALRGKDQKHVRPFSMSFWWRPYSDQNWTAFDAGMDQYENRFVVFVQDGEQGQELTFRCCANTRWQQGAEVYVPLEQLDYEPGNWYHIRISCAGEDPATMQLLVDGVDIGKRRGLTITTGSVSAEEEEIRVDSTQGFPIRGAIRIGTEIIEYDTRGDSSFRDCVRGARGTLRKEWPTSTPVHNAGYALPLLVDVMKGGGYLDGVMNRWQAVRIQTMVDGKPDAPEKTIAYIEDPADPSGPPLQVQVGGFGPDTKEMSVKTVGIWGEDDDLCADAFNSEGLALLCCPEPGNLHENQPDEPKLCGWEVVRYERQGGNDFYIERYKSTFHHDAATEEEYFMVTEQITAKIEWPSYLVPLSVLANGTNAGGSDDYLDPSVAEDLEILQRYPGGDGSARVLIGTDSATGPAHEIIKYDSIDRETASSGILFVRDKNLGTWLSIFFGKNDFDSGSPPPSTDPDPVPDPTPDPGGGGEEDPQPGGGVPPGDRDPTDEDPDGGDTPTDEPDAGEPFPGDAEEEDAGEDGDGEGDEPLDEGEEEATEEGGEAGEGGVDPTGSSDGDGGETAGEQPPAEEPTEDESGGGGDFGNSEDGNATEVVPEVASPVDRQPDELEEEQEDRLAFDPRYSRNVARRLVDFRGVNRQSAEELGGIRHLSQGSSSEKSSLFLPCFRVKKDAKEDPFRPNFIPRYLQRIGRNDVITITDGGEDSERVQAGVRWGDISSTWCALDDFIDKRIKAEEEGAWSPRKDWRGHARVLKFPSGELPDEMSKDIEFGQSTISDCDVVKAFLDELCIWQQGMDTQLVIDEPEGILEDAEEIRIYRVAPAQLLTSIDGFNPDCGVLQAEGELIIYRGSRTEGEDVIILEDCARAQLGTKPLFHPFGAPVRFLADMPVSYVDGGLTAEASTIPLATTDGWPREGLARIIREDTSELVHYTRRGAKELIMPVSIDADIRTRDRGLFRGRFGTDPTDHDSGEIVVFQPFRFWDRFAPRRAEEKDSFSGVHIHPESSYFELGKKLPSAFWRGMSWTEENLTGRLSGTADTADKRSSGEDAGLLDIYVLARFNPNVPWDTDQVLDLREETGFGAKRDLRGKKNTHLFLFADPGSSPIGQGRHGNDLGLESDTAEFRMYFVYKPNAFIGVDGAQVGGVGGELPILSNTWKQTPWVSSFTVSYYSRTMTRHRATIR